ncbi:MAG TPA: L-seryl-tRNA(Sec) selenium transferase [Myxococcota bacterium]|nr:L-seryl-tRNA(Sec) selenium transferase [Myxococcota bacterium]
MNSRALPAIDRLLRQVPHLPRSLALREARRLVADVRAGATAPEDWAEALTFRVQAQQLPLLRPVINATGVVLHTNLGRAPMSAAVAKAVAAAAEGYLNLELDLETGERGERLGPVRDLLRELCGADDALVVNNNAAAVLLALSAIAAGREVVVSRGELVEIGGSFRVPEVIAQGGARLVEVGTTNRTRSVDYENASGVNTGAWLLVHPSNFKVVGFTERPERKKLAELAHLRGIPLLEDLGAGALVAGLGEPTVAELLEQGVDLVMFSGDKLLGGPQAGILVGRADLIQKLRKHPLYRALRVDRLVLAALEATLRGYLAGELPPAVQMIQVEGTTLLPRLQRWQQRLAQQGISTTIVEDVGFAGGGSLPGEGLPGPVLCLEGPVPALARLLRQGRPAVLGRIKEGSLRLDPRTVREEEEEALLNAVVFAWLLAQI